MTDPIFVPHITLDGIVAVLAIIGTASAFLLRVGGKLTTLELKVTDHGGRFDTLDKKLDRLVSVAEIQARHDERLTEMMRRLNAMEAALNEMRHGEGFVLPLPMGRPAQK